MSVTWTPAGEYEDIRYELSGDGIAKITIDRPEVRNAFRPQTVVELSAAFERAREDPEVGVVILTGEGPLAFCSGGDQRVRGDQGYETQPGSGVGRFHVTDLHVQIRRLPKPVVAMVAGYAIGGGHVLHLVLRPDDRGRQRPLRPDRPARGLVRRRLRRVAAARPRRDQARQGGLVALPPVRRRSRRCDMGLVNAVVPLDRLEEETVHWCREMLALSPFALRLLKASFHAPRTATPASSSSPTTPTSSSTPATRPSEGREAYKEKRAPDFSKFPRRP